MEGWLRKNLLAEKSVFDSGIKFRSMTLPDEFIEQIIKKYVRQSWLESLSNFKENL